MALPDIAPDRVQHLVATATTHRRTRCRQGLRYARWISAGISAAWLLAVVVGGWWPRVVDAWPSALTMVFGSFVAGATPQGGGAVAFPVFTKVLAIPSEVARSMGLCIQTMGMGTAAVAIVLRRTPVAHRALRSMLAGAIVGFGVTLATVINWGVPFAPTTFSPTFVRIGFTVLVTSMGVRVALRARRPLNAFLADQPPATRYTVGIGVAGIVGGSLSALTGSGADVVFFVVGSLLVGIEPRRAVATSVIVMAALSGIGFAVFGVIDGGLALTRSGSVITAIAGHDLVTPLPAQSYDLFAFWLAAIPVVVWFAPLGATFAARVKPATLGVLVAVLAGAEFISTVVFVPEVLRSLPYGLLLFGGTGAAIGGFGLAERYMRRNATPTVRRREYLDTSPSRLERLRLRGRS